MDFREPCAYLRLVSIAPDDPGQLGLLDLDVDLSVPEVYSGTEFTLYLHIKNPFARAVWIRSVELSLPAQLSSRQSDTTSQRRKHRSRGRANDKLIRTLIREREAEITQLRQSLSDPINLDDNGREAARARLEELETLNRQDLQRLAGLSSAAVINADGNSEVHVERARTSQLVLNVAEKARVYVEDFQAMAMDEPERVPLTGSLPRGAALQPGSTDVWTIRLGSRRNPFFIPATYHLQLTVIYGMDKPKGEGYGRKGEYYDARLSSDTTSFTLPVRTALWSVILGGVFGGMIGSVGRSLQQSGTVGGILGSHLGATIGALILAVLLSGAAVIFGTRKAEAQSFITVEDFWGGVLVGFLIGYSGTAAFTKITGAQV